MDERRRIDMSPDAIVPTFLMMGLVLVVVLDVRCPSYLGEDESRSSTHDPKMVNIINHIFGLYAVAITKCQHNNRKRNTTRSILCLLAFNTYILAFVFNCASSKMYFCCNTGLKMFCVRQVV